MNLQDYVGPISPYLAFHSNNAEDPFTCGSMTMNTKWMEVNVLDLYYASLWNAKWPHNAQDPETYWGYVLSMGATEGNLYSACNARDYLSGKFLFYDPASLERASTHQEQGGKENSRDSQSRLHTSAITATYMPFIEMAAKSGL